MPLHLNKDVSNGRYNIGIKVHLLNYLDNSHFNVRLGFSISKNI